MLHGQHLSTPGPQALQRWEEHTPNLSMRMTALAAALLRPQLQALPAKARRWNQIHDRIAAGLARSQHLRLPERPPQARYAATSVQFSVRRASASQMERFLARARARGLPVKWFGVDSQTGFTSAPRHWRYAGEQGALAATDDVLSTLCDIRTPVTMTDEECDLAAAIVREAIQSVISEPTETSETGPLGTA